MLVNIINGKVNGTVTISNAQKEQEFLENNPSFIKTDFEFTESQDLYEYDGTTFNLVADWETLKSEREAELANATLNEQGVQVPNSITARQARLALISINKLADVETAINSMPSPDKEKAKIEWEYATEIERNHTFVANLAAGLGLNDTEIDNLFIEGAKL